MSHGGTGLYVFFLNGSLFSGVAHSVAEQGEVAQTGVSGEHFRQCLRDEAGIA